MPGLIDVHSHVIPMETMGGAGDWGPEMYVTDEGAFHISFGPNYSTDLTFATLATLPPDEKRAAAEHAVRRFHDPVLRLEEMDAKGLDVMGVTISPIFYFYEGDPTVAPEFARVQNDALAKYCSTASDRLFFMATLPLQNMEATVAEIDRVVTQLGARGLNLGGSRIAGRELDDRYFDPLWERAEHHGLPIMIHPEPWMVVKEMTVAEKLCDFVYQDTIAFLALTTGGVLDRFPGLRFYISHGGGFLPYQFSRFDVHIAAAQVERRIPAKRGLRDYLGNFYFDILLHDVRERRFLVDFMGADNLLVGDNYSGVDNADGARFVAELELPKDQENKILHANARSLFKLD